MNKLMLCLTSAALLFSACAGDAADDDSGVGRVTVSGSSLAQGDSLVLLAVGASMVSPLDTAVFDGSEASLSTNVGDLGLLLFIVKIQSGDYSDEGYPVILEPGKNIKMTLPSAKGEAAKFENSRSNELWYECQILGESTMEDMSPYAAAVGDPNEDPEVKKVAEAKLDSAYRAIMQNFASKIIDNAPSAFSDILLGMYANSFDDSTLTRIVDTLASADSQMPNFKLIKNALESKSKTSEGQKFIDFTMMSIDGKSVKLSDVVSANKLTLVDFWASWCGPCRAEMPAVVRAYEDFKDKGLAIVGVSLDQDAKAWTDAVNKLGMKWIQVSDLKGWQSEAAHAYSVDAIPACVLIDSEGVIVARNLRGDELSVKIGELLK